MPSGRPMTIPGACRRAPACPTGTAGGSGRGGPAGAGLPGGPFSGGVLPGAACPCGMLPGDWSCGACPPGTMPVTALMLRAARPSRERVTPAASRDRVTPRGLARFGEDIAGAGKYRQLSAWSPSLRGVSDRSAVTQPGPVPEAAGAADQAGPVPLAAGAAETVPAAGAAPDGGAASPGLEDSIRPRSLSPSRAGDFLTCPLLYRFRVIDRLPEPPSPAAARGTLVHAVLERLFDHPAAARTPQAARALLGPEWARLTEAAPELAGLFYADELKDVLLAEAAAMLDRS